MLNTFRLMLVCVDKYENKNPVGRVYNSSNEYGVSFNSVVELLQYINTSLDKNKSPQAYSNIRMFKPVSDLNEPPKSAELSKKGALGTFAVNVLFRQNSSWQGSVMWYEGGQEESFRSVLELLMLMDSALSSR